MKGGIVSGALSALCSAILCACGPSGATVQAGAGGFGNEPGLGGGPGTGGTSSIGAAGLGGGPGTGGTSSTGAAITGGRGAAAGGTPSSVLPVLWLNVNGQEIPENTKIGGSLRVIEDHDGTLTNIAARPSTLEAPIGIEYRGEWSLQFPKKGYSIELRDAGGNDLPRPLLGMPEDSDWVLRAAYYDHTLMRDALGFWLFREIWGRYAARSRFVEVYLDGNYEGVYLACEKIKRSRDRVDLPKVALDAASGDLTGGYLVHIESNSGGEGFETQSGRVWEYGYPNAQKISPEQQAYLKGHFERFEQAMAANDFADPANGYARWLDVPAAVDFALFQELARNTDGYTKSSYYQKLPDSSGGKLLTAPIWDNDLSFGNFANGTQTPEGWLYEFDWNQPVPWWERLFGDATFRNAAACRWQALRNGPLTPAAVYAKLDEFTAILAMAQPRENARWQLIGHKESRSAYVGATWIEDIAYLKSWLTKRIAWLDAGLSNDCKP
jgi:hypothetical protein